MIITSVNNEYIKELNKLKIKKYRDQKHLFLVEGKHLVQEAYKTNKLKQLIIKQGIEYDIDLKDIIVVSDDVIRKLSTTVSTIDMIGVCEIVDNDALFGDKIIMLDKVQDPGNVGTIIRTALAFGFKDIFLSYDSADIHNQKVIRSSQGAIFSTNIRYFNTKEVIKMLKEHGYIVYGTALKDSKALSSFKSVKKLALVFGNEGQGISKEILDTTTANIFIEIAEFESLNVAIAASICMYHFASKD